MKKMIGGLLSLLLVFLMIKPVEAATVSETETLVRKAEQYATALKWQISVEHNKTLSYPDMKLFNQTKDSYNKALTAVRTLKEPYLTNYTSRLNQNVKVVLDRSTAYIDALTSGKKMADKTARLKELIDFEIFSDVTEQYYHDLSEEVRKQATLLYRVYGKTTRDAILAKFKAPAEIQLKRIPYIITVKMSLDRAKAELTQEEINVDAVIDELYLTGKLLAKVQSEHQGMFRNTLADYRTISKELGDITTADFEGPTFAQFGYLGNDYNTLHIGFDYEGERYFEFYDYPFNSTPPEARIAVFEFEGYDYIFALIHLEGEPQYDPWLLDVREAE
ncbi:hypothetical protein [Fictibacillus sp. 18YEL24]|uniref:hypothetical protein n=1 Tax=Fictibacillus sp. 18YEL24 TaxID=2745875 RepID=UPI0018CD813B|nr:hypothetical protein [Fictibacillus sp. 18YEL24]MBH0169315.1 hypothetical protein [Fictibacillus sp. 18YEL24]